MTRPHEAATAAGYHVYGADISPFAQRVVVQLEFKGLPFVELPPPGGLHSDAFARINPIGKIPVLKIGDALLPESEVICEYIEQIHPEPSLLPDDPLARARGRLISRIADQYVMNPMIPLFANLARATRDQAVVDRAIAAIRRGLEHLDHWIAADIHANAGRLTLADLAAAPILRYAAQYPPIFGLDAPFAGLDNVAGYAARCREDPHIDRALGRIEAGWAALRAQAKASTKAPK
jgi:glutathione S-transferase